jgi:pimeloyl-ACP methyl ester carboxylesterase
VNLGLGHPATLVFLPHAAHTVTMCAVGQRIRARATAGLSPFLLVVGVAVASAGQNAPARADVQNEATWAFLRARNARDYAIVTPNGIDEGQYVEVGGIQQWITIRGEDRNNPVLLFLHGGPGDATNPWGYAGFRLWFRHFTVVQWDQRGAGRTFGNNRAAPLHDMTVARMTQDGVELADILRKQLRKDKIVLVGHSWGSILGVLMVKARPDLFYAFVGTGQVADPATSYTVAHRELLKKAETLKDERAIRELLDVGPPPYRDGRGYGVQRKWSNFFEGADAFIASMVGFALTAPGYTLRDVNDWFDGQNASAERLVPQTSALDARTLGGDFAAPVFVIQGAEDFTTPTSLARSFIDAARAPDKGFVAIEGSGHFAVFMKSSAFLDQLVSRVLPLATR